MSAIGKPLGCSCGWRHIGWRFECPVNKRESTIGFGAVKEDKMKKETVELEVGSWPWALYKMSQGLEVSCKVLNNYKMFAYLEHGMVRVQKVDEVEDEPIDDHISVERDDWFVFDLKAAKEAELYEQINELEDQKKRLQDRLKNLK